MTGSFLEFYNTRTLLFRSYSLINDRFIDGYINKYIFGGITHSIEKQLFLLS